MKSLLSNPTILNEFRNAKVGMIKLGRFAIVVINSIITKDLEPWGIYIGNKKVGTRNKEEVLKNYEKFLSTSENERVGNLFR